MTNNSTSIKDTTQDCVEKPAEYCETAQPHLVGVCIFNADLSLVTCNNLFLEFFDLPENYREQGDKLEDILRVSAERNHFSLENVELLVRLHTELVCQYREGPVEYVGPYGFYLELNATPLDNGQMVVTYADVTACKMQIGRVEKELATQKDILQVIMDNIREGVSLYDGDLRLRVANRLFLELLRYPDRLSIPGTHFEEVARFNAERGDYGPGDVETLVQERVQIARTTKLVHRFERVLYDGTVLDILGKPLPDGGFIGCYADLTERKKMSRLAFHDSLTDLPNRRLFEETLTREMEKSKRTKLQGALLYLNLDSFKGVNDSLGHEMGDQVLQESARRISECMRAHDLAARLGGDEFAVVLDEIANREDAIVIAERIIQSIATPVVWKDMTVTVGCSVGVAYFDSELSPKILVQAANRAMYSAKATGKGIVKVFEGNNVDITDPNFI